MIKNTNTKIIHRLVSLDDQIAVGTGLGLEEHECRYLNQLSAGTALAHKEGMSKPVEISVFNELQNEPMGDIGIKNSASRREPDWEKKLKKKRELHESGLLESHPLQEIALGLANSFFLSDFELNDLLPDAITKVKKAEQLTYIEDKTIEHALSEWFYRILFSATLSFKNKRSIDQEVLEIVRRLWQDRERFDRGRFIDEFGKWSGYCSHDSIRDRIKENISNDVIFKFKKKKIDMRGTIDKMLLFDDLEIKQEIMNAVRKRVM